MSTAGTWYAPAAGTGGFLAQLDGQVFSNPPFHHAMEHQDLASDQLQGAPAAPAVPSNYIDPEHTGEDRELLEAFYRACQAEGGTADEIHLRGLRAAIAADRQRRVVPVPREVLEAARIELNPAGKNGSLVLGFLERLSRSAVTPATVVAEGEVEKLARWLEREAVDVDRDDYTVIYDSTRLRRAADLLRQRHPAPPAPPAEGEIDQLVSRLRDYAQGEQENGWHDDAARFRRAAELLERHAAPVPKLALAPANDYNSRWLEEDGVMKPVINWIHTIPIEDKDIFHCAQSSCWCSPKVDKDNPEIILHQALTSAQDGWVLIGEIEAASEKPDSLASPPPSELIAELIPELRKVAEHLRDCNFRGFSNYVARAAELLGRNVAPVPVPVSERLPGLEPEDCDAEGRCWLGGNQIGPPTWLLGYPAWAKRFPDVHPYWLPAHALPLPSGEVE